MLSLLAANPFGQVSPPPGVDTYNALAGSGPDSIGLLIFINRIITVFTVALGIYTLFNFILAGYKYITAQGNTSAHQEVRNSLTMSMIGLVIIASSYTIMALLGLLFFGSASYFLNPVIQGP